MTGVERANVALKRLILADLERQPRSLQKEIGPSEVGHPCPRWLGYRLAGVDKVLHVPPWRQNVGTQVHKWLDELISAEEDWLPSLRVPVGQITPGRVIWGTMDAYHIPSATVVDFKIPGPNQMRIHRSGNEAEQYEVQVQCYGAGAVALGLQVEEVMIIRLPSAGELAATSVYVAPFNPGVASAALARVGTVAHLVEVAGPAVVEALPGIEHYCSRCDYFRPNSEDLLTGCPGVHKAIKDPTYQGLIKP